MILKKFVCTLLAMLMFLGCSASALAAFDPETSELSTKYVVLMEANSGAILYEKNADETAYPASTTKIMTAIVALENGDLEQEVTVGEEVWRGFGEKSSLMGLSERETVTLRDLLYGLMLVSGNDAAAAIAVHIGGSISGFADMMNAKAAAIGMTGSHFVNPHGVHKEDAHNTVTARDMAVLTRYCLTQSPKSQDFRAIVKRGSYDVAATNRNSSGYHLENSNKLVYTRESNKDKESFEYSGAIGVKTGDTNAAKRCLVAAAERDTITLVAVLLYDEDNDNRFRVAADLFDYGFSNCATLSAQDLGLPATAEVVVKNCSFDDAQGGMLELSVDLSGKQITGLKSRLEQIKNDVSNISTTVTTNGELTAPVEEGASVATVAYQYNGETLFTADAYATRSVMAMSGGVVTTPDGANDLMEANMRSTNPGSPWLFWILVIVAILIIIFIIRLLLLRRRSRRRRSRRSYVYRGRR